MKEEIAYCGLQCHLCPLFIATMNNDITMKKTLAKEYSSDTNVFTLEDMSCMGCHNPSSATTKMCGDCKIRACASSHDLVTCAECNQFPCSIIDQYAPAGSDHRSMLDRLATI